MERGKKRGRIMASGGGKKDISSRPGLTIGRKKGEIRNRIDEEKH